MTDVAQTSTTSWAPARWATRSDLAKGVFDPAKATGLLLGSPTLTDVVPLSPEGQQGALQLTRTTLAAAGLEPHDRVVVALNNDGDLAGQRIAEAAAKVSEAAVSVGPRGRMRLIQVLERLHANVLIATPTGAADLLARLHMEFLADPLDLELRLLVLTGEIADEKTYRHLASEFGATVVEVFSDPVTGIPVGHRGADRQLIPAESDLLDLAALDRDELLDASASEVRGELVVRHTWHPQLNATALRTGYVTERDNAGVLLAPAQTVGDELLVRGRWLSIAAITAALRKIDGITHWRFEVSRKGTLDAALLTVSFNRESLIRNGMWKSRIEQAFTALTPISITVAVDEQVREEPSQPEIIDHRGHHLGVSRAGH